jgi:superfamily I DNA/RNA helicase
VDEQDELGDHSSEPKPPHLLQLDGSSFAGLGEVADLLGALDNAERKTYRNANASAIACAETARLVVIAGPGAGKSHLFIERIEYWLATNPGERIYVATFVRKLINDLAADIEKRLSEDDQLRVSASTLHTLARSLLERAQGTQAWPLQKHIRIIDARWAPIIWQDVLAFHEQLNPTNYRLKDLEHQLHTESFDDSEDWNALRGTYRQLSQFFNAVGFAYLIRLAREAAEQQPELIEHRYWIIDEYQDFNPSEDHLIRVLRAEAAGTVLAGDDEQALYKALKASDPSIIIGHYEDTSFAKAMLPFCSRCSYYICGAASAFIQKHRDEAAIEKIYLPLEVKEEADRVHVIATASPSGAVDYVRRFLEEHKVDYDAYLAKREAGEDTDPFLLILSVSGALTITRKTGEDGELRELVAEYAQHGSGRSGGYYKILAYATAGWHENDNFAWRKVLHFEGVSIEDAHALIVEAIEQKSSLSSVVRKGSLEILDRATAVAEILDDLEGREEDVARQLAELVDLDGEIAELAEELANHPIVQSSARSDEDHEATETVGLVDSVALMTITGSKGLSAHNVIILGCDDVNMGNYIGTLPFFVALTRARESLHLVTATKANGAKEIHPFVLDLPPDCCDYGVYKKGDRTIEALSTAEALVKRVSTWAWQQTHRRSG